jgi:hypothetical protein
MPRALSWILVAAAAVAASVGTHAQAPASTAAQAPAQTPGSGFATSTTAVVVDVVVRDEKGAPVLDLKPADFELLEDGQPTRLDLEEVRAKAAEQAKRLHARL